MIHHELKKELENTIADYEFAGQVWMSTSGKYVHASSEAGKILTQKYSLVPAMEQTNEVIDRATAFNTVVRSARMHTDKASSLKK